LNPERWQQISRIFKSAISLDPEARNAYVVGQCGSDDSLRAEVEKLIASHQQASDENFIGGLAAEAAAPLLIVENDDEPPHRTLNNGQQFGSYVILEALGAGGMGEVYLARDTRLDRTVALKILPPDISTDKRRMQRFSQEAKVASSLNQPNILTVYEFGEVGGLTFLATEFVDGETLREYLRGKKKLKLADILDINIQVLAALDAAHEASIVHRDIKPENVMIRRRDHVVKVLDFGLAKVTEKRPSVLKSEYSEAATEFKTAPGIIMGTINYMSPEQAQARATDQRTDIWSTGVMLYEMVAGKMPFSGATTSHTIVQILENEPLPLSKDVPAELDRIVLKAMAKDPDERYQTAKDMLIDLRRLKKKLEVQAEIDRTSSPSTERAAIVGDQPVSVHTNKRRLVIALVTAMLLVTAAIFGINMWRSTRERANTVTPASPVPATSEERTLTYSITVQKFRNNRPFQNPFTLASEINFEADYKIRVNIRSPQAGYLYILNEGPPEGFGKPEFVMLFPSPTANLGSPLLVANQVVQIPEKFWIQFDKQQGTEKLWLVFSSDAVPELEAVKEFVNPQKRGLITDPARSQAVRNLLSTQSAQKTTAEKGDTQTTLKSPGKLLVYAVKLEHH